MWPRCFEADGLPKVLGGSVTQERALSSSSSQKIPLTEKYIISY